MPQTLAHGLADRCGRHPGWEQRWVEGGQRGHTASICVSSLRAPIFKGEKKGFSDGTYFGFCKGDINFLVMK